MSELNPYAKYLVGRPLETMLAEAPAAFAALLDALGPDRINVPIAPGKWSPTQIICHLADCEMAFGFRLRQTLAEDNHTIQPFDQDHWATPYSGISAQDALVAYNAMRRWNLILISSALPRAADKLANHPERGAITFQIIAETMAGHDVNHLEQLRKLV